MIAVNIATTKRQIELLDIFHHQFHLPASLVTLDLILFTRKQFSSSSLHEIIGTTAAFYSLLNFNKLLYI